MPGAIEVKDLSMYYGANKILESININFLAGKVTAIIGPSGSGKTTLLRSLNRLSEMTRGCRVSGKILLDGEDIQMMDPTLLRRRVGMVFQKPNPFPMSIRENVLYGIKANGHKDADFDQVVKTSLVHAALWDELKGRLKDNAWGLSLGQQQRLCIARCIAVSPDVILMDEPASSLDPLSTAKLEATIGLMRGNYTVIIVTHNMQQARRVSDYTAFVFGGKLVEFGPTGQIFEKPTTTTMRDYIAEQVV